MIKSKVFSFLITVLIWLTCASGECVTYYMATNGNNSNDGTNISLPWLTLTKAAASMRAGDTLYVRGGTYNCDPDAGIYQYFSPGYFTVNGGVAGQGTQKNPIIVTNYFGEIPLFINANLSGNGVGPFTLGYNAWIKIFGMSVSNCNLSSISLISVTNCEIAYCNFGPSATNKRGAILSLGDNCYSNYIHHCAFFGCWSTEQTNNVTGRQGESGDIVSFGMNAWSSVGSETTSNTCRYNMFATNSIYHGGHSAFNPQGARDFYVLGNTIHNEVWINWPDYNQLGGHRDVGAFAGWGLYDGNDFSYAGNPIANDGAEGIGIFGQNNIIRRNRIHHNENFGLTLYEKGVGPWHPNNNHIYQNTFAHNALGEMSQTNYYALTNIVPYVAITDLLRSKCVIFMAGSTNNTFVDNIFAFNGGFWGTNAIEFRSGTNNEPTAFSRTNWFNDLTGDPKFLNDTNQFYFWGNLIGNPFGTNILEFSLAPDSPCIDSGDWLTTAVKNGSGTSLTVADPWYFWAGISVAGTLFSGDTIQLEGQAIRSTITAIDYSKGILTLNSSLTWTNGQGVALAYGGTGPDMGAIEYLASNTITNNPTKRHGKPN